MFLTRYPVIPLLIAAMLAVLLLSLPLRVPIGPNFWDLFFHMDAAYRIALGQVPHVDFFAPAGALPFYVLAGMEKLFPSGAPLLQAQYGFLFLAGLLLAAVCFRLRDDVARFGLLITVPFALFALFPNNVRELYPEPGLDGVGLYNRQTGLILFVVVAALWMMRGGLLRAIVLGLATGLLFFLKLNGLAAAFLLQFMMLVSGRLSPREGFTIIAVAALVVAGSGIWSGLLPAYLGDLVAMLRFNSDRLFGRVLTFVSVRFEIVLPLVLLTLVLTYLARADIRDAFRQGRGFLRALAGIPALELAAIVLLLIVYESQNTYGQDLFPLLPALVAALAGYHTWSERMARIVLLLIAACTLPTFLQVTQGAARVVAGAPRYVAIDAPGTEPAGLYSAKPALIDRAKTMLAHYAEDRATYARLSALGEMPTTLLYSNTDYQVLVLLELSQAISALRQWENARGSRFATVMTLDGNDLMPRLLGRSPVTGTTISFEPSRGYPQSEYPDYVAALERSEAILAPHCPETPDRRFILNIARPVLELRQKITLSPCWDLYPK